MIKEYYTIIRMMILIAVYTVGCHFTASAISIVPVVAGIIFACNGRMAYAFSCMLILLFNVIANPILVPKEHLLFALSVRIGIILIATVIIFISMIRTQRKSLNFGFLFTYLCCGIISSSMGYAPIISYIKIINFGVFVAALWFGTKMISVHMAEIMKMVDFCLAFLIFTVLASIVLIPFPQYSYLSALDVLRETGDVDAASALMAGRELFDNSLFCGITFQSQALGPLLAITIVYVICDMYLIKREKSKVHWLVLICALPLLYMTRARVGLVALAGGVGHFYILSLKSSSLAHHTRISLRQSMFVCCVTLVVILIGLELHSGAVSKFVRKTDDVTSDERSMGEAFTESRMGAIELNLYDFRRNPLLGSGFQVWEKHMYVKRSGIMSFFTAPIEKGVLPLMVLGEGGILGGVVFVCFCLSFYVGCKRNKLIATPAMMTTFLMSNLGEATFFSPGAMGGVLWILSIMGGYSIDMMARQIERQRLTWHGDYYA